jgi:hypothetical protein
MARGTELSAVRSGAGSRVVRSSQLSAVRNDLHRVFAVRFGGIGRSRSVAQLVEHRSPKPGVAGSIPAGPV